MERKRKLDFDNSAQPDGAAKPVMNPLTGRLLSQRYHDILAKRQGMTLFISFA